MTQQWAARIYESTNPPSQAGRGPACQGLFGASHAPPLGAAARERGALGRDCPWDLVQKRLRSTGVREALWGPRRREGAKGPTGQAHGWARALGTPLSAADTVPPRCPVTPWSGAEAAARPGRAPELQARGRAEPRSRPTPAAPTLLTMVPPPEPRSRFRPGAASRSRETITRPKRGESLACRGRHRPINARHAGLNLPPQPIPSQLLGHRPAPRPV